MTSTNTVGDLSAEDGEAKQGTRRVLVTGSSGFIGSHLCRAFASAAPPLLPMGLDLIDPIGQAPDRPFLRADLRDLPPALAHGSLRHGAIVHLAAAAEVDVPFEKLPDLVSLNVQGTLNVLRVLEPRRFFFASSSAVYGDAANSPVTPRWNNVNPLGSYGMSKAMAECLCRQWAREAGRVAVCFRLGNVVGSGCRGFIAYLVRHARQFPDGAVAARARGGGRLIRDYVPVDHVAAVIRRAMEIGWDEGNAVALNVGFGLPLTNQEVGSTVQQALDEAGYRLTIDWNHPRLPAEAEAVVLDVSDTIEALGIQPPTRHEVIQSIREAVHSHLVPPPRGQG